MKKKFTAIMLTVSFALSGMVSVTAAEETKTTSPVKNVIYMIPDGGGMAPFYLADALKQAGGWDRDVYPNSTQTQESEMYIKKYLVGAITTHSANAAVTDSAAAGTALSSGYKTKNGYIGIDPDKVPHANLLEAAQYIGKNTGMISTYEWTNATPASFSAHEKDRGNYAPMSEQIVNQGIDVVLGCGFGLAKWGDISEAEKRGYNIINTKFELENVKPGDKIWGNIVSSAFPYDIEYSAEMPDLSEMTKAAITALDDGNENGFFLMVEGSKVDGGGHLNDAIGMMSEFLAFDEACRVALQYAESRNDTLVVILPDHDTGGMILPEDTQDAVEKLQKGIKPDDVAWESPDHTARNGGLFIYAPDGVGYPAGISGKDIGTNKAFEENVIDNIEVAPYIADAMGVNLDEMTDELFVDVTEMGTYDSELGVFIFNDYPVAVPTNVSHAYMNNDIVDLDGQVTVLVNGKFYVPQLLLDIINGTVEYRQNEYSYPIVSDMNVMPDTTDVNRAYGKINVANLLSGKAFSGKLKFTYPEAFAALDEIDINIDGLEKKTIEFECPEFDKKPGLVFEYDIISDDGKTCSFKSSEFKGLAYAGYAGGEVKIDGIIDEAVWDNGVVMSCKDISNIVMIEDWKGERDLSADFSILWDSEYFYMYAVVSDEAFAPEKDVANLWSGDSVQFGIYHDTENAIANGTAGKTFEEIGIAYMDGTPRAYRFISQSGLTEIGEIEIGDGFDLACVRDGDFLTYELKFKWSELLGYEYTPEVGGVLGFSALINDNDGSFRRGWMEYGSGIGLTKDVNQFVMMPFLDLTQNNKEIKIYVNNERITSDVEPVITEKEIFVPLRAIAEAMSIAVEWDNETETVVLKDGESEVSIQIGNNKITVNDEIKEIAPPAFISNNRTLIPLNTVSESFNCTAQWDAKTNIVTVVGN